MRATLKRLALPRADFETNRTRRGLVRCGMIRGWLYESVGVRGCAGCARVLVKRGGSPSFQDGL
jgi:hypothetical protein